MMLNINFKTEGLKIVPKTVYFIRDENDNYIRAVEIVDSQKSVILRSKYPNTTLAIQDYLERNKDKIHSILDSLDRYYDSVDKYLEINFPFKEV